MRATSKPIFVDVHKSGPLNRRYAISEAQKAKGEANRERVREWFRLHLCGTSRECAASVGLSEMAVGRHVKAIRAEWEGEQK